MTQINSSLRLQLSIVSIFFLILMGSVWIYWNGLQGIFLFDDVSNLWTLELINQQTDHFAEMVRFTMEGMAGPLGRPISLFSFALQAHHWPLYVWHFKYVNLMIHLLNGCLIFWLLLSITQIMGLPEKRRLWLALITTSLWLLHPLQVSTVLYVVQRMAELSALFTLAALVIYVRSRQQFAQGLLKPMTFWILISIGIGLGGILATLSKENGILLVLYVVVLEATVLRTLPKPRYFSIWSWVFLYFPLLALAGHFILNFEGLLRSYDIRDFTLIERLLTEARILIDYLFKILASDTQSYGLFHDDYPISRGLLTPITTLPAVGFVVFMLIAAVFWRTRYAVFSLGVLWFLAGHLLESSFIGLELYFEHRNYLPMLWILFAVIYGLFSLFDWMRVAYLRKIAILLSTLYMLQFPVDAWLQVGFWAQPYLQAMAWAEQHPKSRHAQLHAAHLALVVGETETYFKIYQRMLANFPEDSAPYAIRIAATCRHADIPLPPMPSVIQRFQSSKGDNATVNALSFIIAKHASGHCTSLSAETLDTLLKTLANSSVLVTAYRDKIYHLYTRFYENQKRYADAIRIANQSLSLSPNNKQLRLQRLIWLQFEGHYAEALADIAAIRANLNLFTSPFYVKALNRMEKSIRKQLDKQP